MGGFLGLLMGSMEETHKSVAGTAAGEVIAQNVCYWPSLQIGLEFPYAA